jgi:MFS family permease
VAQALDSPLMLTLVRDTYQLADRVDELLDTDRFGNREAVEGHLLDRVLPAAYAARPGQPPSRYTLAQAQQWLGFIAHKMNQDTNNRDLAWWLIPGWKPSWPRIVVTGLVAGLAAGFVIGLTTVFEVGLMAGPVFGLTFGLTFGPKVSPPNQIGRLNLRRAFTRRNYVFGLVLGLVGLLMGGLLVGLLVGLVCGLMGVLVGMFVCVLANPAADAESPIDPLTCWRRDRWWGLVTGLVAGLVAGLMTTLMVGLVIGLVIGLVAGLISSMTWPTALVFGQLRCAKECPMRMLRFLEDARRRQVLRIAGPIYQFRHGRLQQRLARTFEAELIARSEHRHSTNPPHDTFINVR